jgi:ABC-type taurine transport system ATPase subunit
LWLSIRMQDLVKRIRKRFDHQQARLVLKETYQAKMIFAHNGGMWRAGPELLNLCAICDDTVVLLDIYDTPIQVNTNELQVIALQLWQEQMNAWHAEYEEMSKQR